MAIPIHRPDGTLYCETIRLDSPIEDRPDQKYIWPNGKPNALDVHPYCVSRGWHRDSTIPLLVCEGVKKADAVLSAALREGKEYCVVAINGCWGWRGRIKGSDKGSVALADWQDIALDDRRIVIITDSDFNTNPDVQKGYTDLAKYLMSKTKEHYVALACPPGKGLLKQGADDYLLEHSLDELLGMAKHPKALDLEPPLPFIEFLDLDGLHEQAAKTPDWLVRNVVSPGSISLWPGHSGALKTWHALDLAISMAVGAPTWMGHPDFIIYGPIKVGIISKELNAKLLDRRLSQLIAARSLTPEQRELLSQNLRLVVAGAVDLGSEEYLTSLHLGVEMMGLQVLILDSLSMTWDGDENKTGEVKQLYRTLKEKIVEPTGVAIILIHHLAKPQRGDQTNRTPSDYDKKFDIRGSGQLVQQADTVIRFDNYAPLEGGHHIQITHLKSWLALEPPSWLSRCLGTGDDTDGFTLQYDGLLEDALAHTMANDSQNDEAGQRWLQALLEQQPAMRRDGMSRASIQSMAQRHWPRAEAAKAPGETKIRGYLDHLVDAFVIQLRETGAGERYVFPDAPIWMDPGMYRAVRDEDDAE